MKKLNIKKYLSLGNIVCMIDDGVLSFIENSIRKETIESKINYLINSFSKSLNSPQLNMTFFTLKLFIKVIEPPI